MILTVLSIVLGFTIGFVVRPAKPSADALMWMGKNISNTSHGLTSYTHLDRVSVPSPIAIDILMDTMARQYINSNWRRDRNSV